MRTNREYRIVFPNKIGEEQTDNLLSEFYSQFKVHKQEVKYIFDISKVEWFSNQSLLVFTGLFKTLFDSNVDFNVHFLENGSSQNINERKARQFVQLWNVWKIYKIVHNGKYENYFDLDGNLIERLQKQFNISSTSQEIYDNYGVTPFITLEKIDDYDDFRISEMLLDVYALNDATNEVLRENKCFLPFENDTISLIITKELYENFLDHYSPYHFNSNSSNSFLSISLKRRIGQQLPEEQIQKILKSNFKDESLSQLKDFYFDKDTEQFKNFSCLQLSFMDFGIGICSTLKKSFLEANTDEKYEKLTEHELDSKILEYAFQYDSSQHEILERYKKGIAIPRGLFDILSVVKRFKGVLIARSNYGKIVYDFSNSTSISDSIRFFNKQDSYFPGTLISVYIPERENNENFDYTSIKPFESNDKFNFSKESNKYVSLFDIQEEIKSSNLGKDELYNKLFSSLFEQFSTNSEVDSIIYFDFKGYQIDERISKKIIYFLCTDYRVNLKNNVIVLNPPNKSFLKSIQDEISNLEQVDRNLKFHPTPFIFFEEKDSSIEIFWLGVYSERDIKKLNDLLLEEHDLRHSDFDNPDDVIGNVNRYDNYGNLSSVINSSEIIQFYRDKVLKIDAQEINKLIKPCILEIPDSVFLCNGNYYQFEYLQLFNLLCDKEKSKYLSQLLFEKIKNTVTDSSKLKYVGITSSSHKILSNIHELGGVSADSVIYLNNYFSFEKEKNFIQGIKSGDSIVLICDVISTGYMVDKLDRHLKEKDAELAHIGVIFNAIDDDYNQTRYKKSDISEKLSSLYDHPLKKYSRNDLSEQLKNKTLQVIRINPFTNTPILKPLASSNFEESVVLQNSEFVEAIESDQILVGYYNFNNLIHPYFFDMGNILSNPESSKRLLEITFNKLDKVKKLKDLDVVVFPKNSGINNIDFDFLENHILKKHGIIIYELDRFATNEGWRFSHPAQFLIDGCDNKDILILDDGSCTGESILQMIDEVAFLNAKEITVLSIVGRINDHKREFFSRIKSVENNDKIIPLKIVFGCHWHIPTYYLAKSPVIEEKNRLEALISFPNTPNFIKRIAKEVLKEVNPKDVKDGSNKHLLKSIEGENIMKDLVLLRDEIGKISEFRFYKDSFLFFDDFIARYESKNKKDRGEKPYMMVEKICAVFLHEPYLFESVRKVVPDVVDKLEEFIEKLFWAETKINLNDLYYKWDNKNLFHLIFIIYKNDELFQYLSPEKLTSLIKVFANSTSDLAYVLFKLTAYCPITDLVPQNTKFSGKVHLLVNQLIEDTSIGYGKLRILKRFRSFTSSLQSSNDYEALLSQVKTNYERITDDKYHNEWVSAQHDLFMIQILMLAESYNTDSELKALKAFEVIDTFISDLLSFSQSYPEFFIPFGNEVLTNLNEKLRAQYGELSDKIFQLSHSSDFERITQLENFVYDNYIKSESLYYKIFKNLTTSNLQGEFTEFVNEIKVEYPDITIVISQNLMQNYQVDLPLKLIRDVLFSQMLNNFRHAAKDKPINIDWIKESNTLQLKIINTCRDENVVEYGGGSGLIQLMNLNNFPGGKIDYSYHKSDKTFTQNIIFRI